MIVEIPFTRVTRKLMTASSDGNFTPVPNKLLEALCRVHLSGREMRVVLFIVRQTFGFHRDRAPLSLSRFAEQTRIERREIWRVLKRLEHKHVIVGIRADKRRVSYCLERDPLRWQFSVATEKNPKGKRVGKQADSLSGLAPTDLSAPEPTPSLKERKKKEDFKESSPTAFSLNEQKPGASKTGSLFAEFLEARRRGHAGSYQKYLANESIKKGITVEDVLRIFPDARVIQ